MSVRSGAFAPPDEGGIFHGDSFFVSSQAPQASHWNQFITANGGAVTKTEKTASVKIGDHAKPKVFGGKGFISWKFLEDCRKEGRLVDRNDPKYTINQIGIERQKSTTLHYLAENNYAKRPRTVFTEEDNYILLKRLTERRINLSGNAIYQELAAEYPHHSAHSWRGRWVDVYAKRNPDPEYWFALSRAKMGDIEVKKEPATNVDAIQPPKKKARIVDSAPKAATAVRQPDSAPRTERRSELKPMPKQSSATASPTPKQTDHRRPLTVPLKSSNSSLKPLNSSLKPPNASLKPSKATALSSRVPSAPTTRPPSRTMMAVGGSFTEADDSLLRVLRTALQYAPSDKHGEIWEDFQDTNSQHSMRKWKQRYAEIFEKSATKPVPAPAPEHSPEKPTTDSQKSLPSPPLDTKSDAPKTSAHHSFSPPKRAVESPTYEPDDVATDPEDNDRQIFVPRKAVEPPKTPPRKTAKSLKRKREYDDDEIPGTPDERLRAVSEELGTLPPASSPPRLHPEPSGTAEPTADTSDLSEEETADDPKNLSVPEIDEYPSPSDPDDFGDPRNYEAAKEWMDDLYLNRNIPWHRIQYALMRTTSSRALSEILIDCMKKGKKFPSDEGIWSSAEDKILLGGDSKSIERLEKRKGREEMNKRLTWLLDQENPVDGSFEEVFAEEEKEYLEKLAEKKKKEIEREKEKEKTV